MEVRNEYVLFLYYEIPAITKQDTVMRQTVLATVLGLREVI